VPLTFDTFFKSKVITSDAVLTTASGDHNITGMFVDEYEAAQVMEIEIESSNPFFEINNSELIGDEADDGSNRIVVNGKDYKIKQIIPLSEPITRFILTYD